MEVVINSLPVFLSILLGVIFRRYNLVDDSASKVVATIAFKISIPFLVLKVLYGQTFGTENLLLLVLPIVASVISVALGLGLSKAFKLSQLATGSLVTGMMSFSIGSFAYPFILQNFSEDVFQRVVLVDIVLFFIVLTVGYAIAVYYSESQNSDWRSIIKKIMLNPIVISMVLTLAINYANVELPTIVLETADFFAKSFSFLASFLLGLTLTWPKTKGFYVILSSFAVRTIALGVLVFLVVSAVTIGELELKAILLSFMTPYATIPLIFANELDLDKDLAAQLSVFTKIIALVGYPVLMSLLV